MSINQRMIEDLGSWCLHSAELNAERVAARRTFFGDDDPRPVSYIGGAEDRVSRERRFLGWFMFDFVLPNGETPGAMATRRIVLGRLQAEVLKAVARTRFVLAVAASVTARSIYLELEDERFDVQFPALAARLSRGQAIVAHIVPDRHGYWVAAPGWFGWPIGIGPGMRAMLKRFQLDPIAAERFLQGRVDASAGAEPRPRPPEDRTLAEAVARMTDWAKTTGHEGLVLSVEQWHALVLKYLDDPQITRFVGEAFDLLGEARSEEEINQLAGLVMNIWNNAPQPDRGGKSANQMVGR